MKRMFLILLAFVATLTVTAQLKPKSQKLDTLHRVTAFPKWQSALVGLANGRVVRASQANIFLKHSTLIFLNSKNQTMETPTRNINSVEIGGRHYERVDSILCWLVDTVGKNALFCCERIDLPALKQMIVNSRSMTNLDLGTQFLNTMTVDNGTEDIEYPIRKYYYYRYNGKWVWAQDRAVWRVLPKGLRQNYRIAMSLPNFSWSDPKCLLDMLRRITK